MLTDCEALHIVTVSMSLHLSSFSPRGALNMVRHPVLSPACPFQRCMAAFRGNRQGLLRVSEELRGMSSIGLSEVLVTCQINISLLSSRHAAPTLTQTHTHTTAKTWWWYDWQLPLEELSLNPCLCFCCRALQFNGWQVEAKEGQSTWTRFRRWTDTYSRPMTVCSVSNRWGSVGDNSFHTPVWFKKGFIVRVMLPYMRAWNTFHTMWSTIIFF